MNTVCPGWSFASNHADDPDGRIILIWKGPVLVDVLHSSRQSMTVKVSWPGIRAFCFTAVYAANTSEERNDLWIDLITLHSSSLIGSSPWLIGGDFNEILHPSEHSCPSVNQFSSTMIDFKDCLDKIEARNLRYQEEKFTWSNKQPVNPIAKKLDRALIDEDWLSVFPRSFAKFLAPDFSNHAPCCISLEISLPVAGSKPYKFFNYLVSHPDFLETVAHAWSVTPSVDHNLSSILFKQKSLRVGLESLDKDNFSDIQKRVSEASALVSSAPLISLQCPCSIHFLQERQVIDKLNMLKGIEEKYFKQKSRINWLASGDQNSDYFHKVCKTRNAYNSVLSLAGLDGQIVSTAEAIG
ncbi:uncharacterized protein LOC112081511 [Eutrema salsugineum]|uniref:uncharacterized protein LOC112081511 n=1 Tax=Eutrema salsugineum TaxID=72664 RepID=UPI000CECFFA2|nr:uncharacterized protein LOC112081511 [Eutrema salsugineum]